MNNLIQKWTHSKSFFPQPGHLFQFSKKGRGGLSALPPSSAPVSGPDYTSISVNIPKYP